MQEPVPINISAVPVNGAVNEYRFRFFRLWSDGTVDTNRVSFVHLTSCEIQNQCGPVPIIPGTCTADITRNGEVEVNDFLEVIGQWGPCE